MGREVWNTNSFPAQSAAWGTTTRSRRRRAHRRHTQNPVKRRVLYLQSLEACLNHGPKHRLRLPGFCKHLRDLIQQTEEKEKEKARECARVSASRRRGRAWLPTSQ